MRKISKTDHILRFVSKLEFSKTFIFENYFKSTPIFRSCRLEILIKNIEQIIELRHLFKSYISIKHDSKQLKRELHWKSRNRVKLYVCQCGIQGNWTKMLFLAFILFTNFIDVDKHFINDYIQYICFILQALWMMW